MDSLTQITLGAAVGEVVLGRRAGNRAMLWGAIAGTVPDLDVLANVVTDEISALAFHRAFTHSLAFALLAPPALGLVVHRLYGGREGPLPGRFGGAAGLVGLYFLAMLTIAVSLMPVDLYGIPKIALIVSAVTLLFPLGLYLRERWRRRPSVNENPGWWAWTQLFFWAIVTHPLLDCFTTYGTQLYEPFSAHRVAWNTISVVDPIYTVPFLLCVVIAARYNRTGKTRRRINQIGLIISSAYLLFTVFNKLHIDGILRDSLNSQKIEATRFMTTPTIFNNILWSATVETDTSFYLGQYSLFDAERRFDLLRLPKNHHLLQAHWNDREVRILRWFSDGYFNVFPLPDGRLQYNDLRFGNLGPPSERPEDFVFKFILEEQDGQLVAGQSRDMPADAGGAFRQLWRRIWGRK